MEDQNSNIYHQHMIVQTWNSELFINLIRFITIFIFLYQTCHALLLITDVNPKLVIQDLCWYRLCFSWMNNTNLHGMLSLSLSVKYITTKFLQLNLQEFLMLFRVDCLHLQTFWCYNAVLWIGTEISYHSHNEEANKTSLFCFTCSNPKLINCDH